MTTDYIALTVELPEGEAELLEDRLVELGSLGLEIRDREAPPMPGVRGPNPGEAIVIGFFDKRATAQSALKKLGSAFPHARAELSQVEQRDWSTSWRALIKSTQVGRLWVGPPWEAAAAPKDRVALVIEPKMAFGTGDHPTTTLCLQALDDFLAHNPGASVLDVGTGTGVLAIAAKKLGAARVVAVDNDDMSVTLARENAELNHTPQVEISGRCLEELAGRFDLVLANILANTLVELAPALVEKVANRIVLAGVLEPQADEVERAFVERGLRPAGRSAMGSWVRLELTRP